jgi:hypothetical protein
LDHDSRGLSVQLLADINRERRLNGLRSKLRRLLGPLLQYDEVSCVARLIEQGKADVRRLVAGTPESVGDGQPALFEFQEPMQLCFYASAKFWRTFTIKPHARARILQLAKSLIKAAAHQRKHRAPASS